MYFFKCIGLPKLVFMIKSLSCVEKYVFKHICAIRISLLLLPHVRVLLSSAKMAVGTRYERLDISNAFRLLPTLKEQLHELRVPTDDESLR